MHSLFTVIYVQVDLKKEASLPEIKKEASSNNVSFLQEKHTMPVRYFPWLNNSEWRVSSHTPLTHWYTLLLSLSLSPLLIGGGYYLQIPRIILTHPSTSDEDVELLILSPGREQPYAFDICDSRPLPDCFDNAFYPPWPQLEPRTSVSDVILTNVMQQKAFSVRFAVHLAKTKTKEITFHHSAL